MRIYLAITTEHEHIAPLTEDLPDSIFERSRIGDKLILEIKYGDFPYVPTAIASASLSNVLTDRRRIGASGRNERRRDDDQILLEHRNGGFGT
jgi:hypothetical protein